MNTPPTSPTLVGKLQTLESSRKCLARDLERCGTWCPRSPCSNELRSLEKQLEDERLLYMLVKEELDLVVNRDKVLGGVPFGCGAYSFVYEIVGEGHVVKFPKSKRQSRAMLAEVVVHWKIASQCCRVVPVLGVSYVDKRQFPRLRSGECVPGIVMPKLKMTVQQFYETEEVVPRVWWRAAEQMLQCLQSLKAQRFIHGDIKTANILIDFEVQPDFYLADFSTSKEIPKSDDVIQGHSIETTMEYCAPETLKESIESFDSDLYSLGLCLLAMITRHEPFRELQRATNHGNYSGLQSQWLMNAVLKNDPINLNVLNETLCRQWSQELSFLSLLLVERLPVEKCLVAISQFHHL